MENKTMVYDVIVVGSGPAGYTAALYSSRAFLKTLLIEGNQPGGQLTITTDVDNYPGFSNGIQGPQLMVDMKKQVERFGATIISDVVTKVDFFKRPFTVWVGDTSYLGKAVIIATGASAKYLGLASEEKLRGKGVSACATCDGFFFRGKEVVVIGGGDTAMEEATFLTKFSPKVTIIHRRDAFRASAIMLNRAKKDPKISFLTNKKVEEIVGEVSVSGVKLKDTQTGEVVTYNTQGFFLAIGHEPNTKFLQGIVELDPKGYILTFNKLADEYMRGANFPEDKIKLLQSRSDHYSTSTSIAGAFAAGDCVDHKYKQAVVAAGQGCMAAMDAEKWLQEHTN